MRPISAATLAILKSQNLIGQDKFNHELRLEGYEESYGDIIDTFNTTVVDDVHHADFAIRSDGKVLFVYSIGTSIYTKVIDSESEMLSTSGAGNGGTLLMTVISTDHPYQNFALQRLNNGKLLLIVIDRGDASTSMPYTVKSYISDNGLGTDFELSSTIHSFDMTGLSMLYTKVAISPIAQDEESIWFACTSSLDNYSGQARTRYTVYKSTDGGNNWTVKYIRDNHVLFFDEISSFVCIDNTRLFLSLDAYGITADANLWISTDNGETWTELLKAFSGLPPSTTGKDDKWALSIHADKFGKLYMVLHPTDNNSILNLYTSQPPGTVDYTYLNNIANWTLIKDDIPSTALYWQKLKISPNGTLHVLQHSVSTTSGPAVDIGMTRELYSADFHASSISISKGRGGANTASIQASNLNGSLNPKNPDSPLYGIIGTNKQVIIKQGYGDDLIETFTGLIDGFEMSTWPQTTNISLRDKLKKALDQTVTYGTQHTIHFELQAIENIVGYLCYLAGIETGDIATTGIQVAKTFSWESYADCFQFLGDLASFEWGCDEYGKFYFRRDYQPDDMYVAYTFEEGVDISALKYTIKDDDLYYKVVVFGKSGDTVISYEAPFLDAATYNIMPQKILKIDATEATTIAELKKIAERAIALMQSRTAVVNFTAVAVPWLQVGDFIGVYERSTGAASIYRISSLKLDMDSDSFTMSIDAYYYGDSIVPGELPTEEATQTAAPTTNVIPEMTSNTAPSGVVRASSVYTSAYEPWQAFNSTDADLYWNAITNTGWIEYQFPEKMIVDKYSLKARQAIEYNDAMPKAWTFEGFDGAAWVVLDTRSAQTSWGINEVRTFLFTNTTAYSKYRLNVSANNGYNRLQLEQLAMYYGGGS